MGIITLGPQLENFSPWKNVLLIKNYAVVSYVLLRFLFKPVFAIVFVDNINMF